MNRYKKVVSSFLEEENSGCKDEYGGGRQPVIEKEDWRILYKNSIKSIEEVSKFFKLKEKEKILLKEVEKIYHMRIPLYYFSLIQNSCNFDDPIKSQCIPSIKEIDKGMYEKIDPLGEEKTSPLSCLVHRYPDRVLLLVTSRCFMYCRHCTRKRLWQNNGYEPTLNDIEQAVIYLKDNKQVREVIVSGGDPLTLPTEKLDYILSSIANLENIKVIRIGTRAPVVLPHRIDEDLCATLEKYNKLWINVQFNHPREITPQSTMACKKLQTCGIPISNQSVLLKGINDDPKIMTELCNKLQEIRVRPYYLFQCDPVVGAYHFRTSVWKGIEIIEKMRGYTSGMCVPTFVVDGVDGKGKVPLEPNCLISTEENGVTLKNYKNESFFYPTPIEQNNVSKKPKKDLSIKTIGIVFNLKKKGVCDDRYEEYDDIETIETLKREIERYGFEVILFEQNDSFFKNILDNRPDFVFNLAEGIGNTRCRESQVPLILETLGIPYSGSDAISLGITLDKYLTNLILKSVGIPVPLMFMIKNIKEIDTLKNIFEKQECFIVKPRWEGSSKGIFLNSVVNNFDDLKARIAHILSNYNQPALVEEFLEKEEITVGVCGNSGSARILGMMKITPQDKSQKKFLYSLENKKEWQTNIRYESQETIDSNIKNLVKKYALGAFHALEIRDFARIDFRVDKDNVPKIIDINPLPGLSPFYSDLPILYKLKGGSYSDLIKTILRESFKNYRFKWKDNLPNN